jgi:hypothetical protein
MVIFLIEFTIYVIIVYQKIREIYNGVFEIQIIQPNIIDINTTTPAILTTYHCN